MCQAPLPNSSAARAASTAALASLRRFPPLSPAAAKLFSITLEDSDLREIAQVIHTDPALTAAVLRLVNSPLFSVRQSITSVLQATALLGLDRLRVLATTAALRMRVTPASASQELKRCWRHSVACAYIAQ